MRSMDLVHTPSGSLNKGRPKEIQRLATDLGGDRPPELEMVAAPWPAIAGVWPSIATVQYLRRDLDQKGQELKGNLTHKSRDTGSGRKKECDGEVQGSNFGGEVL